MSKEDFITEAVRVRTDDECWPWPWALTRDGYSTVVLRLRGNTVGAYRLSYELRYGSVPEGLTLHHTCFNRWCWNPDHVKPTTRQENMLSGPAYNLHYCPSGHSMVSKNTLVYTRRSKPRADGSFGTVRVCRECHRLNSLEQKEATR